MPIWVPNAIVSFRHHASTILYHNAQGAYMLERDDASQRIRIHVARSRYLIQSRRLCRAKLGQALYIVLVFGIWGKRQSAKLTLLWHW
jgi:hypothetical protein